MTTTVVVKARAWGATVVTRMTGAEDQSIELSAHEDITFHIEPGQSMTLEVTEPAEAPVAEEAADEASSTEVESTDAAGEGAPATSSPRRGRGSSSSSSSEADEAEA